jgi:hypothetical protein
LLFIRNRDIKLHAAVRRMGECGMLTDDGGRRAWTDFRTGLWRAEAGISFLEEGDRKQTMPRERSTQNANIVIPANCKTKP